MGVLEQQAMSFWTIMQKLKHGVSPLTRMYAKESELPTLAAQTDSERLQNLINKEITS